MFLKRFKTTQSESYNVHSLCYSETLCGDRNPTTTYTSLRLCKPMKRGVSSSIYHCKDQHSRENLDLSNTFLI